MDEWLSASPVGRELMRVAGEMSARRAMERLASDLSVEAEITKPPVNLLRAGSFQNVRRIEAVAMAQSGRLIPDGDGFLIQVNAADRLTRQRFSIGHEIGHTLIPSYRANPHRITETAIGRFSHCRGDEVETLCDIAAAELLLPMRLFGPLAAEAGCSLGVVDELAEQFQASLIATTRRLVETQLWRCALVVWRPSGSTSERLCVRYAVHSCTFGHIFRPAAVLAPGGGCLVQCWTTGRRVGGYEQIVLEGHSHEFFVQAARADYGDDRGAHREIISLIFPLDDHQAGWPGAPTVWSAADRS